MCGLFGSTSFGLSVDEVKRTQMLGILSQFRGVDSTGLAVAHTRTIKKNRTSMHYDVFKDISDSSGFFYHPTVRKELQELGHFRAMLGHCRAATHGSVTKENAHPYIVSNLIGAHNGTINSLSPGKNEEGTDSLNLYRLIQEQGISKTVKDISFGAYALTWFDTDKDKLYMVRNKERDLWLMFHKTQRTTYWASEKLFLDFMRERERIPLNDVEFELLPPYQLYSFDLPGCDPRKETLEEPVKYSSYNGRGNTFSCLNPWTTWEQGLEQAEEEKKTTLALPPPRDPTFHNLIKSLNTDIGKQEEEKKKNTPVQSTLKPVNALLMSPEHNVSARAVFPNVDQDSKDPHPYPIRVQVNNVTKILRYKGWNGRLTSPYSPELANLLDMGCCISTKVARPWDRVIWLDQTTYCMPQYRSDEFLRTYYDTTGQGATFESSLSYYPLSALKENMINERPNSKAC